MSASRSPEGGPCPLCGLGPARPLHVISGYAYVACASCGAARLEPMPAPAEQAGLFGRGYFEGQLPGGYLDYAADEPLHRLNARDRLAVIAADSPGACGSLLDVGCASGYFLDEARAAGWRVAGVDVSDHMRSRARRDLGLDVFADFAEAASAGAGPFDVVTFYQVLEHMADPLAALREARALLKPGGLLVIETWDRGSLLARVSGSNWQQLSPPSVVFVFDRPSLEALVQRAGFGPPRIRATSKRVRVNFAIRLLSDKMPVLMSPVARLASRTGLGNSSFRHRLGDLITAVANPA